MDNLQKPTVLADIPFEKTGNYIHALVFIVATNLKIFLLRFFFLNKVNFLHFNPWGHFFANDVYFTLYVKAVSTARVPNKPINWTNYQLH